MTRDRRRRGVVAVAAALLAAVACAPAAVPSPPLHRHALGSATVRVAAQPAAGAFELTSRTDPRKPVRWLACAPIEYRINPTDMPKGMGGTIHRTMAIIEQQTGARFRYAGRTKREFDDEQRPAKPMIAFGFTKRAKAYGQTFSWPGEIGVGGPAAAWYERGGETVEAVVFGRVLLSTRFRGEREGPGATWQSLILHETGHALNLAHRAGRGTVMHPTLSEATPGRFRPAEVAALKRVLQTKGCDYAAWRRL